MRQCERVKTQRPMRPMSLSFPPHFGSCLLFFFVVPGTKLCVNLRMITNDRIIPSFNLVSREFKDEISMKRTSVYHMIWPGWDMPKKKTHFPQIEHRGPK